MTHRVAKIALVSLALLVATAAALSWESILYVPVEELPDGVIVETKAGDPVLVVTLRHDGDTGELGPDDFFYDAFADVARDGRTYQVRFLTPRWGSDESDLRVRIRPWSGE